MSELIKFFLQHWELTVLFVALLIAVIIYELRSQIGATKRVTPQQTVSLINHENAVIVDARDKEAFKAGHIINSVNISINDFEKDLKKIKSKKKAPIIVVCGTGFKQSAKIAEELTKDEFMEVKILDGGINAWVSANLPLEKN